MQLQRGLQVYTEVCSACHGLQYVPFRTLGDSGGPDLPDDQVRAYAEFYEVFDAEIDDFRVALPTDHFPESGLENAPDLSLMAKKRAGFHGPYGLGISQTLQRLGRRGVHRLALLVRLHRGGKGRGRFAVLYENERVPRRLDRSMGAAALAGDDVEFADGHSEATMRPARLEDVSPPS